MKRVRRLMQEGLVRHVFPGAVLLVSRGKTLRFHEAYGTTRLGSRCPVRLDTPFDLASLTKPLATTLALLQLVEAGRMDLDGPINAILPPFKNTDKSAITIRQLLCHRAGLPAYRPYFIPLSEVAPSRRGEVLKGFLIREPLMDRPGKNRCYSDIGFMILQWLVETAVGESLDRFVKRSVYSAGGFHGLFFPGPDPSYPRAFAATERCALRRRILQGETHDENACIMGGVGGHAGLFGTAEAVWTLLVRLTNIDKGRTDQWRVRRDTVTAFVRGDRRWGPLGFDTPSPRGSSSGRFFGPHSIGHLGFTGTSFWVDLDREVIVVLLTNRVHPSRNNYKIKFFRPELHDVIMKSLADKS